MAWLRPYDKINDPADHSSAPQLGILSLGAGVQSSAPLSLTARGDIAVDWEDGIGAIVLNDSETVWCKDYETTWHVAGIGGELKEESTK